MGSEHICRLTNSSDHPWGPMMSFNKLIRVYGGLPTGRYIGAGRDKSGPTGGPYPFTRPWVFRESSLSALAGCSVIRIRLLRQGSNECDSFERLGQSKINPVSAQEAISEFIFHRLDCSKLSH